MEAGQATALLIDGGGIDLESAVAQLERGGFGCIRAEAGSALHEFHLSRPDLLVLAAPGAADFEVLATTRKISQIPTIALLGGLDSAEFELAQKMGVDSPLRPGEHERLREELRRLPTIARGGSLLADEFIELDLAAHRVSVLGNEVALTPIEFRLLATFLRHPGQALSHSQLLTLVWGHRYDSKAEVKLYVSYLRRKLRAGASIDPVVTVRGVGYRYEPRRL